MHDFDFDFDYDALPLAHAVIAAVRRAGGQVAADLDGNVLLFLPPGADQELLQAVELAQPWLMAILHTRQALQRAAHFARGCRWRRKGPKASILAPIEARRGMGA
jgi:hypothetical protein